jgi:hypothetical protein
MNKSYSIVSLVSLRSHWYHDTKRELVSLVSSPFRDETNETTGHSLEKNPKGKESRVAARRCPAYSAFHTLTSANGGETC